MELILLTMGAFIFLVGYFWTGFHAVKNDPGYGKWAFMSIVYRVNYCRVNWNRTKIPCSLTIIGLVVFFIGMVV